MLTVRQEVEIKLGKISDQQFELACKVALDDLNFHKGGIFTVSEYQEMVCRSIEIIKDRNIQ